MTALALLALGLLMAALLRLSGGTHSYGSTVGYGSASTSFTNLAEVVDADPDVGEVGKTKMTHLNSPNACNEYTAALGEPGSCKVKINYDKTTYNTLNGFYRVNKWWKIAVPDGGNLIGLGFISKLPITIPDDDRVTDDMMIQFVTKPTFQTT